MPSKSDTGAGWQYKDQIGSCWARGDGGGKSLSCWAGISPVIDDRTQDCGTLQVRVSQTIQDRKGKSGLRKVSNCVQKSLHTLYSVCAVLATVFFSSPTQFNWQRMTTMEVGSYGPFDADTGPREVQRCPKTLIVSPPLIWYIYLTLFSTHNNSAAVQRWLYCSSIQSGDTLSP